MQPPALRALLTINVVIYVLWVVLLVRIRPVNGFVWEHLALNAQFSDVLFEPWQLITYNFLHLGLGLGGFLHILFNMLWLVWIGREYEELHGAHRLLALYVITGIGGGLLTIAVYTLFPGSEEEATLVHGASASVLGVLTAVAVLYPYKSIALIFIGTVRLIYVVLAFLALDLLFLSSSNTAVTAHLGGAFFGFLFARAEGRGIDLTSWAKVFFRSRERRSRRASPAGNRDEGALARMEAWLAARRSQKADPTGRSKVRPMRTYQTTVETTAGAVESEIDRILDKISEQGYDALTDEEKRTLYEASRK